MRKLDVGKCGALAKLGWSTKSPGKLKTLKLRSCFRLESDSESLTKLWSLRKLYIGFCKWETLSGIEGLHALEELVVEYCSKLADVSALGNLHAPALAKLLLIGLPVDGLPTLTAKNLPTLRVV